MIYVGYIYIYIYIIESIFLSQPSWEAREIVLDLRYILMFYARLHIYVWTWQYEIFWLVQGICLFIPLIIICSTILCSLPFMFHPLHYWITSGYGFNNNYTLAVRGWYITWEMYRDISRRNDIMDDRETQLNVVSPMWRLYAKLSWKEIHLKMATIFSLTEFVKWITQRDLSHVQATNPLILLIVCPCLVTHKCAVWELCHLFNWTICYFCFICNMKPRDNTPWHYVDDWHYAWR